MAKRRRAGEAGPSAPQPAPAAEPAPEEGPAACLQDVLSLGPAAQAIWAWLGSEVRPHARLTCRAARAAFDPWVTAAHSTRGRALQHLNTSWPVQKLRLDWSVDDADEDQQLLAGALRGLPAAFRHHITDLQLPSGAVEAVQTVRHCKGKAPQLSCVL